MEAYAVLFESSAQMGDLLYSKSKADVYREAMPSLGVALQWVGITGDGRKWTSRQFVVCSRSFKVESLSLGARMKADGRVWGRG